MLHTMFKNGNVFGVLLSGVIFTVSAADQSRFRPITKSRILSDLNGENGIKQYIETTKSNVWWGEAAGERMVGWTKGITSKTFRAMPVEFFKDSQNIHHAIEHLGDDQAIAYMNQVKSEFIQKYIFPHTKEFKINLIAGFLHDQMVDHLPLEGLLQDKKKLKDNPLLVADLLKYASVKKQYMNLTCQNLVVQFYIEKEFGKAAAY